MYFLTYALLYCISLLPSFILYRLSDFAYLILYYVVGYRKKVVFNNLNIAFPEKSFTEKKSIAKKFYRNLTDTFIETIALLSMSEKTFLNRNKFNLEEVILLAKKGKSIQFHSGHQFNWEYANWVISKHMPIPFVGVYMKISNKAIDKIFYNLRSKKGTVLVATHEFKNKMHQLLKQQYSIGLAADQNPGNPSNAYWLNFFNRPVPFVTGPDKGGIKNNTSIVFVRLEKIKRGNYRVVTKVIAENAADLKEGQITKLYRDFLEESIRANPDNYLWSHRRWRWEYNESFADKWIDDKEPLH